MGEGWIRGQRGEDGLTRIKKEKGKLGSRFQCGISC